MTDIPEDPADDEALFDAEAYEVPGEPPRPITELAAMHREGTDLMRAKFGPGLNPDATIFRVRDVDDLTARPDRIHEMTVRVKAKGGKTEAEEWTRIRAGAVDTLAYAWLDRAQHRLSAYVLADAHALLEDITTRPGCLILDPAKRRTHHAPGGAEFYVVDIRRVRPETIQISTVPWASDTSPIAVQDGML